MSLPRFTFTTYLAPLIALACLILIVLDRAGIAPGLHAVTTLLYTWTILLGGFALLLGVVNVLLVHVRRIQTGQTGWTYSLALVATLFAVFIAGLIEPEGAFGAMLGWIFENLIAPGQAMLFALTAFFLAAAAYRLLRIGRTGGVWMLTGVLLVLITQMPVANNFVSPLWAVLADWTVTYPATATIRGAILGSALALVVAGVRFLIGRSQP